MPLVLQAFWSSLELEKVTFLLEDIAEWKVNTLISVISGAKGLLIKTKVAAAAQELWRRESGAKSDLLWE